MARFFENSHEQGNADPFARSTYYIPNDSLYANQWNLNNTGQSGGTPGVDINVTGVWDDYTGAGVNVAVYDDGVQYTHPDLNDNYNAALHITIGGVIHDPAPAGAADNHGTAVAGLIGAENDGTGTVGVAFGSTLVGAAVLNMSTPDLFEAMNQQSNFDVVNHSWGFTSGFAANSNMQGNADPFARSTYYIPNDSLYANQWNLNNTGQSGGTPGVDINVTGVWDDYTGAGVNVAVYDDGV